VTHRELVPDAIHGPAQYSGNRAESSHEPTRVREQGIRKFKSVARHSGFLGAHAAAYNLFNLGRDLASVRIYRYFSAHAFASWQRAAAI